MFYNQMKQGHFLARPNRFLAQVEIAGRVEICHVKNTGRCRELLIPGAAVYVQEHDDSRRKTKFSLIAVQKGSLLVNMDSQAPNKVAAEWLLQEEPWGKIKLFKPECRHGNSRFDFYLETDSRKLFIEVKGVTLEQNGEAVFPDAPTQRGVKHLSELIGCLQAGYEAAVLFVVQFGGARCFRPNYATHREFAVMLKQAAAAGVQVKAAECLVTPESLRITGEIPVLLDDENK